MEMKNKLTGIRLETAEDGVTVNLALRFVDAESAREFGAQFAGPVRAAMQIDVHITGNGEITECE